MASLLSESYTCNINGEDGLEGFKVSGINGALLMSFLEELQDEDRDDERLNSVIQSLEAEIFNSSSTCTAILDGHDHSNMDQTQLVMSDGEVIDGSCSLGHIKDGDCSVSIELDHEIGRADHMDTVPCSSPSDDLNWYMEPYGDEMHSMIGFGGVINDYSHVYHGVALDLEDQGGYSSLWQETTYDSMMYESLPPQCTF
ncbi:hypothetical protein FNV43_RR16206 [Rhamnella rubrinervis]|uniref:Uncharacterized protein n=1 Tax=Rhamnella rubrinervis TaxID=2594499 RepID=A0A8K0EAH0_9ROSA|nr:hypothetical protein FNV43_RR16206 [Rhamnella rubrinervis]